MTKQKLIWPVNMTGQYSKVILSPDTSTWNITSRWSLIVWLEAGFHKYRASDRVRKKITNYAEIFRNIMRKKVLIMRKTHWIKIHLFMPPKSSCPRSRECARRQRIAVISPDGTSLTDHFAASSLLHLIRRSSSPWGQLVASVQRSGDPSSWYLWWQIYPYTIANHRRIFDRPNERNKTTGVQAHHEKTRGTPGG